ncbi:MAG: mechanosensitive ion channel, partial [Lachnospiraceae bacterium]|nr:mechanosensitive ion channel [Lachnospiraceae bacterium]
LGIAALVLGFGAESLIADVVTGFFFLFENQFNVGDIIEVDGFRGTVESIEIRTISIKDAGGNVKIINNSQLKNVINRSKQGSVAVSTIGVSYSVDLDELEKKLPAMLEAIKGAHPEVFIGAVSYMGVDELASSSVVLKFKAEVSESNIFTGRRLLNKELKCAFDRAGIEIPFPQLDVHTK